MMNHSNNASNSRLNTLIANGSKEPSRNSSPDFMLHRNGSIDSNTETTAAATTTTKAAIPNVEKQSSLE